MAPTRITPARAMRLAAELDVDLHCGICHACLSFVSLALDDGNRHRIQGELMRMTPLLWLEGLAEPALTAVRRACDRNVPDAELALADLEERGGRSAFARAIVRRLAAELTERTRISLQLEGRARDRLLRAPPEWN